jgi:hypothetical protein
MDAIFRKNRASNNQMQIRFVSVRNDPDLAAEPSSMPSLRALSIKSKLSAGFGVSL